MNQTNIKLSKRNEQIVTHIIDWNGEGSTEYKQRWSRYTVIFADGQRFEEDSKVELHAYIKLRGKCDFEDILDAAIAKDIEEANEYWEEKLAMNELDFEANETTLIKATDQGAIIYCKNFTDSDCRVYWVTADGAISCYNEPLWTDFKKAKELYKRYKRTQRGF